MRKVVMFLVFLLVMPTVSAYVDLSKYKDETLNKQELGSFQSKNLVFWSNETAKYFDGSYSKLVIDKNAYVVDYDLFEGYIIIKSEVTEPAIIVDVFSGTWKKTTIKKGYNYFNFSKIGEYGGLRVITIGTPNGFALIKQKRDLFYFEDYPVVILKSELAKFSWQRAFTGLLVFLFGLGIAYYLKQHYLNPRFSFHLMMLILLSVLLMLSISIDLSGESIKLSSNNQTIIKQISKLSLSSQKVRDMYNWAYVVFIWLGYIAGLKLSRLNYLSIVLAEYGKVRIKQIPFSENKKLARDLDGEIAKIKFKNEIKQYITLNIDDEEEKGITVIKEQDKALNVGKAEYNERLSLAAFLGSLVVMVVADYLNVIKFDFSGALLISGLAVVLTNVKALYQDLKLKVTKEKLLECSKIVNEDSYTRMLKNAEIKQFAEDYNKLLRAFMREKITQPRKVVAELLGVIREVREVEGYEQDKAEG